MTVQRHFRVPCALHTREYHGASAGPAAQDATARAPRLSCSPAEGQRPHRVWKDLQPIVMAFSDGSRGAFCAQGSTWRAREHRRKVSGIFFSTTEPIQAFDQEKKCAHPPDFRLGPLTFVVSHRSGGPARRWASLLWGCHRQSPNSHTLSQTHPFWGYSFFYRHCTRTRLWY